MHPLVDKGVKAYQAARYPEAIALYEQALAEGVDDSRLHVLLASAYLHNGQLELARTHYEIALAQSDDDAILKAAQAGLSKVAAGVPARREPGAITDTLRLPARPREGLLNCPQCGETLVKDACVCGFLRADPDRIPLEWVQAFCAKAELVVFARLGLDTYLIDGQRVCYRTVNQQLAGLDARLVFRPLHGMPMVRRDALQPIAPYQTPWVAYPRPGKPGDPRPYTWEEFAEVLTTTLGATLPAALSPFDPEQVFAFHHLLPPGEIARIQESARHLGLSFCQALLRTTSMPLEALFQELLGPAAYVRPEHRMANAVGFDLLEDGLLTREELIEALTRQVEYPKPLVQVILASTPLSPEEVEPVADAARRRKPARPIRDRLGELLVRQGAITRAQLQGALDEQARHPERPLGEILKQQGVSEQALDEALRCQTIKDQLRFGGQARLGEILVKRGDISRQQLLEALLAQVDEPLPLGEILVRHGMASPEQVFLAIEQQEATLEALVESERDMERQEAAASATSLLNLSLDLEREKQRLQKFWGGLKSGFKAGMKEVRNAIDAVRKEEAARRQNPGEL